MLRQSSLLRAGLAALAASGTLLSSGAFAVPTEVPAAPAAYARGRILVRFRQNVPAARGAALASALGGRSVAALRASGMQVVQLPQGVDEQTAVRAFAARPEVESAQLDRAFPPERLPNDPYYASAWHLAKIGGPSAWDVTTGDAGVTIAILDSGVDGTHPDLAGRMVPGWNFYDNNSNTSDVQGHGTNVAGAAAAATNNGAGVAAVAWNCRLMPVRVTDTGGYAYESTLSKGLEFAANNGARVANLSFAVSSSVIVKSAAQYFQSKGGVVTVSAGNASTFDSSADNPYVLTVSATDSSDNKASWSNTGNNVDLAAPGVSIYTTARGGGYLMKSGTSFSAPVVAGVAALMLSANPALTPAEVEQALEQGALDRGTAGWDTDFGWGRVNAAEALRLSGGSTPGDQEPPTVSLTAPAAGATVAGLATVSVSAADNTGVTGVDFYVNGVKQATDTTAPYSFGWSTISLANGSYALSAVAADAAGNTASAQISVNVSNAVTDTQAPSVSISSPGSGATVLGNTVIGASATDNVGVSYVDFYVDGVKLATDTAAPYSYTWNTTTLANGSHTVKVVAVDAAGNAGSAQIGVTVSNSTADTTRPTVSVTSPTAGAGVDRHLYVYVSASDNVGVKRVELFVDGRYVAAQTAAPFTTYVDTKKWSKGGHTLQVRAYDAAGNSGSSALVTVYQGIAGSGKRGK
ncbi:MAG: Ig-like domain-containing protein [Armatimonadota bacterium]